MRDPLTRAATFFLRHERRCEIVLIDQESVTLPYTRPDVWGVTLSRRTFEVEIKRTVSDFKANEHKPCVVHREQFLDRWPFKFFFLVPKDIFDRVQPICPPYAGLIWVDQYGKHEVKKEATANSASAGLKPKHIGKLIKRIGNQMSDFICAGIGSTNWDYEI